MLSIFVLFLLPALNGSLVLAFQHGISSGIMDTTKKDSNKKGSFSGIPVRGRDVFFCEGATPPLTALIPATSLNDTTAGFLCRTAVVLDAKTKCSEYYTTTGKLISLQSGCYFQVGNEYLAPHDFCLKSMTEAHVCKEKTMISKCCDVTQVFDSSKWRCLLGSNEEPYLPQFHANTKNPQASSDNDLFPSFRIKPINMSLPQATKFLTKGDSSLFHVNSDGVYKELPQIFLRGMRQKFEGEYCLERDLKADDIVMFYDMTEEIQSRNMAEAMGILSLFSVPFSLITAIANAFILQRNIHGFTLGGYLFTLSLQGIFVAMLIFGFNGSHAGEVTDHFCTVTDFIQKILYCSGICWMTAINLDLWLTFRKLSSVSHDKGYLWTFLCYTLFAMGLPCLIVLMAWIVGMKLEEGDFCVLYGAPSLICFSVPILLLIAVNTGLFLRTSLNIKEHRKSTEDILKNSGCINRKSFKIFGKLFLMTGSVWLIRMILLFFHFTSKYLTVYAVVLEAVFMSPEILFFFLVFSSRSTWKKFREKFPFLSSCHCWKGSPENSHKNCSSPNSFNETPSTQLSSHSGVSTASIESLASQVTVESYM